ncbi:MAG: methyl-accepting chemotaxis protein [Shewanellaceae bacterium]|nr:methyl-accepting chemotaxis protein [Shewanellaceae bacterium]
MQIRMNLASKLVIIFILITLIIGTLQNIVSTVDRSNQLQRSLNHFSRQSVSGGILEIKLWLEAHIGRLKAIKQINFNNPSVLQGDLKQVSNSSDFIATFVSDQYGRFEIFHERGAKALSGYNPTTRPWYRDAIKTNDIVLSDVYASATTNESVMTIAYPFSEKGIKGVLGGDLSLKTKELQKALDTIKSDLAYAFLLDRNGKIIYHHNDDYLLQPVTDIIPLVNDKFLREIKDNEIGDEIETYVENELSLINIARIPIADWYMVYVINEDIAFSASREIFFRMIVFSIIQLLVVSILATLLIRFLLKALKDTNDTLLDLSEGDGDLTIRLKEKGSQEVQALASGVNLFIKKLHEIISKIAMSGVEVNSEAKSFQEIATKSSDSLARQQSEITLIATAVHQMSAAAQEVASNAESTAAATTKSSGFCENGIEVIQKNQESITNLAIQIDQASSVISELESNSKNINQILSTIQDIAEQTNLLALNAAIEAARAGDQGRGFAVVADEVRVLSRRTHGSTEEIRAMIENLLTNTESAVKTMNQSSIYANNSVEEANKATLALNEITNSITTISDMTAQIASAAEEQRTVTEDVSRNVESVTRSSSQISTGAETVVSMASELTTIASSLQEQVNKFKLD